MEIEHEPDLQKTNRKRKREEEVEVEVLDNDNNNDNNDNDDNNVDNVDLPAAKYIDNVGKYTENLLNLSVNEFDTLIANIRTHRTIKSVENKKIMEIRKSIFNRESAKKSRIKRKQYVKD